MFNANEALNALALANNGANRLIAMIGAKNFAKSDKESWVSFQFPMKARNKANYLKLKLNASDLYDVEFGRIHGGKYRVISEVSNMYFDSLKSYFEEETGLYLSL